eukprot:TRINITY_DN3833_c0_g1_i2.p1 TRINITY_DN3833_c0_g1~~TRINITY_DN3833_c0_g1_i2.p1  ORF type:complete len:350 (+),score=91.15 TRINITY_DN3833_c0_g1_i2:34-1083(+)
MIVDLIRSSSLRSGIWIQNSRKFSVSKCFGNDRNHLLEKLKSVIPLQEEAIQELKWMESHVLGMNLTKNAKMNEDQFQKLKTTINERVDQRKPLQYILGTQPFGSLDLRVRPPILIPRTETEFWTRKLSERLNLEYQNVNRTLRVLDIGTGSGCISLFLASEMNENSVDIVGMDVNEEAISLAEENLRDSLERKQIARGNSVKFVLADLFDDNFEGKVMGEMGGFDVVVSNPPYIPMSQLDLVEEGARMWEDPRALYGHRRILSSLNESNQMDRLKQKETGDGMDFFRQIESKCSKLLSENGSRMLVMETGFDQAKVVCDSILGSKWSEKEIWEDQFGTERVVYSILRK